MTLMTLMNLSNNYFLHSLFFILFSIIFTFLWRIINQVREAIRISQPSENIHTYKDNESGLEDDLTMKVSSAGVFEEMPISV